MKHQGRHAQGGFNIIELIVVLAIIGILASVAIPAYQDNSRRALMSEVVLAASGCRTAVSEAWSRELVSPGAGNWACERSAVASRYVEQIQTSEDGEVRTRVRGIHSSINGLYVYLKPYDNAEGTGTGSFAGGQTVRMWRCGVAAGDSAATALLPVLPSVCRETITLSGTSWAP